MWAKTLLVTACVFGVSPGQAPNEEPVPERVALRGWSVWDKDCAYELVFTPRRAEFTGNSLWPMLGTYESGLRDHDWARIVQLIGDSGFSRMEPRYSQAHLDDGDHIRIRVTYSDDTAKAVQVYGDAEPLRFWSLSKALLGVAWGLGWRERDR